MSLKQYFKDMWDAGKQGYEYGREHGLPKDKERLMTLSFWCDKSGDRYIDDGAKLVDAGQKLQQQGRELKLKAQEIKKQVHNTETLDPMQSAWEAANMAVNQAK